jgi:hypothetical protein
MQLIGVSGLKGSGKTTLANYLVQNYGCTRVPFAAPIKDMLAALGLTDEQLNGSEKEIKIDLLCGNSPRFAMQTLGTEWGRMMIGEKIWINAWRKKVETFWLGRSDQPVVCDDVRFPNEVALIKAMGGRVIRVSRPECKTSDHPSEALIETLDVDYAIANTGTLFDLRKKLEGAVNVLKQQKKAAVIYND